MSPFQRHQPPQLVRTRTVQRSSHEVSVHWWLYRHHYLEARRARLAERQQTSPSTSEDKIPARSIVLLHDVPHDDLATFEHYVARALSVAQAEATPIDDPDTIEANTLDALIAEAEGTKPGRDGWGYVPEAGGSFYDVKPIPTTDPRLSKVTLQRRTVPWLRLAGGLVIALTGVTLSATLMPSSPLLTSPDHVARGVAPSATTLDSGTEATPTPLAAIGDAPLDALRPTSLEIARDTIFVLPIDATPGALGATWTPRLVGGRAAWLEGTIINLVVCLAPSDHALITGAKAGDALIVRIANGETRYYRASVPRLVGRQQREMLDQRHAGLTLIACGAQGNDRTLLPASLDYMGKEDQHITR